MLNGADVDDEDAQGLSCGDGSGGARKESLWEATASAEDLQGARGGRGPPKIATVRRLSEDRSESLSGPREARRSPTLVDDLEVERWAPKVLSGYPVTAPGQQKKLHGADSWAQLSKAVEVDSEGEPRFGLPLSAYPSEQLIRRKWPESD